MNDVLLSPIAKDDLIKEILLGVESLISASQVKSINEKENWTSFETAQYCKVSKVTIHAWTKKGILRKYKIGNRVFYKKNEVISAINPIEE
jgi:hypothetical protein